METEKVYTLAELRKLALFFADTFMTCNDEILFKQSLTLIFEGMCKPDRAIITIILFKDYHEAYEDLKETLEKLL